MAMATPTIRMVSTARADHPSRAPNPSYHNSPIYGDLSAQPRHSSSTTGTILTADTAATSPSDLRSPPRSSQKPRPSSRPNPLPESDSSSTLSSTRSSSAPATAAKNKKKPSFLGSLFTKEPSADAFLQMQNQARHKRPGSLASSTNFLTMSGASSAKIPECVPKVNSKWDGMPQKSKAQSHTADPAARLTRSSGKSSVRPESVDSRSYHASARQLAASCALTNSSGSRVAPGGSSEHEKPPMSRKPTKIISPRSESSSGMHVQRKAAPTQLSLLRSPSDPRLPQITCFFPDDMPDSPGLARLRRATSPTVRHHSVVAKDHAISSTTTPETTDGNAFHQHTASIHGRPSVLQPTKSTAPISHPTPRRSRRNQSASCPLPKNVDTILQSPRHGRLEASSCIGRFSEDSAPAFLAGEASSLRMPDEDDPRALIPLEGGRSTTRVIGPGTCVQQDLEKRPDSSRARLGLRASMIKVDTVPWESAAGTNRGSRPKIPLSKGLSVFGKA